MGTKPETKAKTPEQQKQDQMTAMYGGYGSNSGAGMGNGRNTTSLHNRLEQPDKAKPESIGNNKKYGDTYVVTKDGGSKEEATELMKQVYQKSLDTGKPVIILEPGIDTNYNQAVELARTLETNLNCIVVVVPVDNFTLGDAFEYAGNTLVPESNTHLREPVERLSNMVMAANDLRLDPKLDFHNIGVVIVATSGGTALLKNSAEYIKQQYAVGDDAIKKVFQMGLQTVGRFVSENGGIWAAQRHDVFDTYIKDFRPVLGDLVPVAGGNLNEANVYHHQSEYWFPTSHLVPNGYIDFIDPRNSMWRLK
jgi:hypothetical protein